MKKNFIINFFMFYLMSTFVFLPFLQAQQMPLSQGKQLGKVKSFGSPTVQPTLSSNDNLSLSSSASSVVPIGAVFYNIHILGEVTNPGTYKIMPSDRLTDAIGRAGGILTNGSERAVQLRRTGNNLTLDLFSYKYRGNLESNPYLMENDVVFVPVKKGEIQIEGPVNRPGNYEYVREISLGEALKMAGGVVSGFSEEQPIRVVRFNQEENKEVLQLDYSKENLKTFKIKKGDVVVVPHVLLADKTFDYNLKRIPGDNMFHPTVDDNVYVMGSVLQPGAFPFEPNFSYKEYVSLAGATEKSKMKSIKIVRRNGEKIVATASAVINPGDTIVVPQKYWKAETIASWLGTITSLTLSSVLIEDRLTK